MRLLCTITDPEQENPYEFSYYLASQGIENECEEANAAGAPIFRIWVYDEDRVEEAHTLYQDFQKNPQDPKFKVRSEFAQQMQEGKYSPQGPDTGEQIPQKPRRFLSPAPYGPVSILILLSVIALFIAAQMQRNTLVLPKITGVIQAPSLSVIEKLFIYDYPLYFTLRDQFFKLYTPQDIAENKDPSPEAVKVWQKMQHTPVWMGIYDKFLVHFKNKKAGWAYRGPLFEKIQEGQIWRVFTPALLHFDLLHIFFNVLWFILLGNQIEFRLGWFRYLILIVATAVISNTAQYLMSGPFFMGLSGVVVGMAAFIWARQQVAPWEGYLLNRFTLIFLAIFVLGMFALQIVFFILQIMGKFDFPVSIANTAHLTGALVGYLLGRSRLFSIHIKIPKE